MGWSRWTIFFGVCVFLASLTTGCGCGDDDDDSGSSDDDDADDDSGDDDTDDDTDDDSGDDDTIDDDTGDDDTETPEIGAILPVDYDGDGDRELLMGAWNGTEHFLHIYLVEPGSFERQLILSFDHILFGEGGSTFQAADFDNDGIWDIAVSLLDDTTHLVTIQVYTQGNFDTPAYQTAELTLFPQFMILDEKNDGFPDILTYCGDCGTDPGLQFIRNEGGSFSLGALLPVDTGSDTMVAPEYVPGRVFPTAVNVTGESGAHQIAVYNEYEVTGEEWTRFDVFDLDTGDLVDSTTPISTVEGNGWSDGWAGDFDGDGKTELLTSATFSDSGIPDRHATFFIAGYNGGVFTNEYESTGFADEYASAWDMIDVDGDGVLDPFLEHDPSGREANWLALDGTDGYSERFTHTRPDPRWGFFAPCYRRGGTQRSYVMSAGADPSLAFVYEDQDGGLSDAAVTLVSMVDGTETAELASFSLGESGRASNQVADLGGDGTMDLVSLAEESHWNGSDWDYEYRLYIFNGANLDEAYSTDVVQAYDYPPWFTLSYDLTGDLAPDPVVVGEIGGESRWLVFPCDSTGCDAPVHIDPQGDEDGISFMGPFL